jgi:hypothetical protein
MGFTSGDGCYSTEARDELREICWRTCERLGTGVAVGSDTLAIQGTPTRADSIRKLLEGSEAEAAILHQLGRKKLEATLEDFLPRRARQTFR